MQTVKVAPRLYIVLTDKIKRSYKLHTLKICAVKLGHHSLYLRAVKHTHKYCFYHIVIMMAERYFVTAETFRKAVKITPSHTGAEVTGRFFYRINRLEYVRFENLYRYFKHLCVLLYYITVFGIVAGVHNDIFNIKIHGAVKLQLLKKLCHKKGILAARYANRDFVSLVYKSVGFKRLYKFAENIFFEFFVQTSFGILANRIGVLPIHFIS